jgi:hypothetical protein
MIRTTVAGLIEAPKLYRPVNGHLRLPAVRAAPQRQVTAETGQTDCNNHDMNAA